MFWLGFFAGMAFSFVVVCIILALCATMAVDRVFEHEHPEKDVDA